MIKGLRRFERFCAKGRNIKANICDLTDVSLLDIGIGGAALHSEHEIATGNVCRLEIKSGSRTFRLMGMVIWINRIEDNMPGYTFGIKFDSSSYQASSTLIYSVLNR